MRSTLALPPPVTRIARVCPKCGGEVAVWGIKRPRMYCKDRKACRWKGPPPIDILLRRAGMQELPGLDQPVEE